MDSNSSVTVGRKKRGNSWLIILLCGLGVVIIGLVVAIVVVNINNGNTCGENCESSEDMEVEDEVGDGDDNNADSGVWAETPEDYIEGLESALAQVSTNKDRADLYFNGAVDLWYFEPSSDNKYIGRILEYLQKVEELNPTSESAWWIYYIEDQRGNNEIAEKYLNISEEREDLEET